MARPFESRPVRSTLHYLLLHYRELIECSSVRTEERKARDGLLMTVFVFYTCFLEIPL